MVRQRARQRGVSYLALLLAVAITNGALAAGATVWSQWQRRERETQLLWAGEQIRRAIAAYSQAAADQGAGLPRSLQDLLLDPRTPVQRRFLRQIYEDPMTRSTDWGLLRDPQGRLVGVYSRAEGVPARQARFAPAYAHFEGAKSYADWRFMAVALPAAPPPVRAQGGAAPASAADGAARGADAPAKGRVLPTVDVTPPPTVESQEAPSQDEEPQPPADTDPPEGTAQSRP